MFAPLFKTGLVGLLAMASGLPFARANQSMEPLPSSSNSCSEALHQSPERPIGPTPEYQQWLRSNNVVVFNDIYGANGEFSNSFPSPIVISPVRASGPFQEPTLARTIEHYYHSQKFKGTIHEQQILDLSNPQDAIRDGSDDRRPLRKDWESVKEPIMAQALAEKFRANAEFAQRLIETRKKQLVFHTAEDSYWGDGGDGQGRNRLGHLLMDLRKELTIENETYRYKANALMGQNQFLVGPGILNRPDYIFKNLRETKFFSQELRNLIDHLCMSLMGSMADKAQSQIETAVQIGNIIEFRVLLNIVNPVLQDPSLRSSLSAQRLQGTLRTALWAALRFHQPEILKELLALEVFEDQLIFEPREPLGLNALTQAKVMGHEDFFSILYEKVKQLKPVVNRELIDSYFLRFPFASIKALGKATVATGLITEEMHARIMSDISKNKIHRSGNNFESINFNGNLVEQILPDAPFLGSPEEIEAFLVRLNQLGLSKSAEDQKLLSAIDPQRDQTKHYYYEPITEENFLALINAAQVASGEFLQTKLAEGNVWALSPYLLGLETSGSANTLRNIQPLLISQKGSPFPTAIYGLLGLPIYCLKSSNEKNFSALNTVSVQWGLSHHIQNKKLVFQSLPQSQFRQQHPSALLLRRVTLGE